MKNNKMEWIESEGITQMVGVILKMIKQMG